VRARTWLLAGLAASLVLATATALYVRRSGHGSSASGTAAVVTAVSLDGFEPVRRPKIVRLHEAVTELELDGFVPVHTMRLTRLN
jgi:hypothetical protein